MARRFAAIATIIWSGGWVMLGACASTRSNGVCPQRSIIRACSPDFREECDTDKNGCEECTCVPIADEQGRPYHEP